MKTRDDYYVLGELLDTVEELQQRTGQRPGRDLTSSSRKLRRALDELRAGSKSGLISARQRKRASGELFRKIIALHPEIWTS